MPKHARTLPKYLVDRYRAWRAVRFEENSAWYRRLAEEGQRPRTMVVSCCDSRVDAVGLFGGEPGDLFVLRNVANLIPPHNPDHNHHGSSAAVEFAVEGLRVSNIVVLGHSGCGGVAACHDMCAGEAPELDGEGSYIGRWMDLLRPAYDAVAGAESREKALRMLEQESVKVSLGNLESFPFVQAAIAEGRLAIHGAWIDIAAGRLMTWNGEEREFTPVDGV